MFKSFTSIFKKTPVPIISVTKELVQKRLALCSNLQHIYTSQIKLLDTNPVNIPLVSHYLDMKSTYAAQLNEINSEKSHDFDVSEEDFLALIDRQVDAKVSELELINSKITIDDLKSLDENYTDNLDDFFFKFHTNRIAASFTLKEYLYPNKLFQENDVETVISHAVKTTTQILTLNDYPIPMFNVKFSNPGMKIYCIAPHIVHIMFELFKNSTIPSITHGKPIQITAYPDERNDKFIFIKISDQGGGMPTSMLSKIWQFHYTTSSTKDRDPIHGFGMGLPLCKVYAEFNNGTLTLNNKENIGVDVFLRLPIVK